MGLLESASSILITGQNPLNGIWFAMKGQRGAVSRWTHLSFKTSTPTHAHPLLWPFQLTAGVWIQAWLSCSCAMDGCACIRVWSANRQTSRQRISAMRDAVCVLLKPQLARWARLTQGMALQQAQPLKSVEKNTEQQLRCSEHTDASRRLIWDGVQSRGKSLKFHLLLCLCCFSRFSFACGAINHSSLTIRVSPAIHLVPKK